MDLLKSGSAAFPSCGELIKQSEDLWGLFLSLFMSVGNYFAVRNRKKLSLLMSDHTVLIGTALTIFT